MNPSALCLTLLLSLCGSVSTLRADERPASVEQSAHSRAVKYTDRDVVPVRAKVRYTTLIILPNEERILDYTCGDKDFWIVDGNENFAFVKPAKAGSSTNVNLITESGNVYSFLLSEVSELDGAEPDLKVFLEPTDGSIRSQGRPRFVTASQLDDYRQQIELAKADARDAKQRAQQLIDKQVAEHRSTYPTSLQFDYRFQRDRRPFMVDAIYHDGQFTYIQASPQETPALYELRDGKPNLVNFDSKDGVLVVSKVLQSGYLAIGKQKMGFEWEGR